MTGTQPCMYKQIRMSATKGFYIDEHIVRGVAALVSLLTLLILLTGQVLPAFFLVLDFALRAFTGRTSPLAQTVKALAAIRGWQSKPVFAPPKKFAAALGFVFSLAIAVLLLLHVHTAANIVAGILLLCAVLESAFKICLGCYTYNWLVVPLRNSFQKNNPHA